MDVKEAINAAKSYVADVYSGEEGVANIGLEEVEYDDRKKRWLITVGFSRPWRTSTTKLREVLGPLGAVTPLRRSYKVLTVSDDGHVISMKNRAGSDTGE